MAFDCFVSNDGNTDRAAKYLNRSIIQFRNFFYKSTPQKKFIFQEKIKKNLFLAFDCYAPNDGNTDRAAKYLNRIVIQ